MSSFRVPAGFCLTADAYRAAAGSGRLSDGLLDAVTGAYRELARRSGEDAPRVAVRSSAVDEDGPLASFAGQHETLLNIRGVDELHAAIERAWASARTEQALAYRARHGLSVDEIGLAVLVQLLVKSDVSGVLFSANPVNGRRDEIVVTASWGLGESIVGGTVTPDSWVLDRSTLATVDERLGEKQRMTVLVAGGTREVDVPRFMWRQPSLTSAQTLEVARLGLQLETAKGWPVDVEFAYSGNELYLLQCRPITTLMLPADTSATFEPSAPQAVVKRV